MFVFVYFSSIREVNSVLCKKIVSGVNRVFVFIKYGVVIFVCYLMVSVCFFIFSGNLESVLVVFNIYSKGNR